MSTPAQRLVEFHAPDSLNVLGLCWSDRCSHGFSTKAAPGCDGLCEACHLEIIGKDST